MTKHAPKVVHTELGWEPMFWDGGLRDYVIESGFVHPTRKEAVAALEKAMSEGNNNTYQAGYAYACGYHD